MIKIVLFIVNIKQSIMISFNANIIHIIIKILRIFFYSDDFDFINFLCLDFYNLHILICFVFSLIRIIIFCYHIIFP